MPKAYVICYVDITDRTKYAEYQALAGPALEGMEARYLARGGDTDVLEGDLDPQRVVIIEFPDAERARRWYDSPAYTQARQARAGAAKGSFILVEGVPGEGEGP